MRKAEKSSVFLLFYGKKYVERLAVAGVSQRFSCPSLFYGRRTTFLESTWKRILLSRVSFCAYSRSAPHSGMNSDILCRPCMFAHVRTGEYIISASSLIYSVNSSAAEQHACQRMSRNLFQNSMPSAYVLTGLIVSKRWQQNTHKCLMSHFVRC